MTDDTPDTQHTDPHGGPNGPHLPPVDVARLPEVLSARPTPRRTGLRQELVRQVVAENVAVASGQLPLPTAENLARRQQRRRALWAAIVPIALVASFFLWRLRPLEAESGPPENAPATLAPGAPENAAALVPRDDEARLTTRQLTPIGAEVFGLKIHRIVIDPGHGGSDTGTTIGRLHEKDLTLDIASRLRARLLEQNFEVHMTRTNDATLTLKERSEMANLLGAHLFVSVHINWLPGSRSKTGVETYFVGATEDPELLELARRENAHTGYDMNDNNQLLKKLFTDARQHNSQAFAQRVQQLLFSSLKPNHPGLIDRGVKQAPFVVLVGTTMPAILAEVACLSSDQDAELLGRPFYRESIAEALSRGIRRYADDVNPSQEKGS